MIGGIRAMPETLVPYEPFVVIPRDHWPDHADELIHFLGNAEKYGRNPEEVARFKYKVDNCCITPRQRGRCYLCLCGRVRYDDRGKA